MSIPFNTLPNKNKVAAFLKRSICKNIHIATQTPDGLPRGRYFGDDAEGAAFYICERNEAGQNAYWTVNQVRQGCQKKPSKADIVAARFAHSDIDPPKDGGPFDKCKIRAELNSLAYPPSFIIDSGSGLQAFWRLDEGADLDEVEALNKAIKARFKADGVHNIDRLMRVPWTTNWPSKAKRSLGRVPVQSRILDEDTGTSFSLAKLRESFGAAHEAISPASPAPDVLIDFGAVEMLTQEDLGFPPPSRLRQLLLDPKNIDRSADTFAFSCEALRLGFSHQQIAGFLLNPDNPISAHALDQPDPERAVHRVITNATVALGSAAAPAITKEMFWWVGPQGEGLFMPTRELWPASTINGALGKINSAPASHWLSQNRLASQMVWAPGQDIIVSDKLMQSGSWCPMPGAKAVNTYRPALVQEGGDSAQASRWLDLVERIYPKEAEHLIDCLAHRVQYPAVKLNHAIVLGGNQGIGKDSMLEPVKQAVGAWNWADISPTQAMGRFNGFLKSIVLRISEARDLGDADRYAFYDRAKTWICAPPDVHMIDEKNRREYPAQNVTFVIITTNRQDSLHLEPDDRRYFVAWSELNKEDFPTDYWPGYYRWLNDEGGLSHVAAYLKERDLSGFDPKAPPPKTEAFHAIMHAGQPIETGLMADVFERLGWPDAVTIRDIEKKATGKFHGWLQSVSNAKRIAHRLRDCGYELERNPERKDGRWKIGDGNVSVYTRTTLSKAERLSAVRKLQSPTAIVDDDDFLS